MKKVFTSHDSKLLDCTIGPTPPPPFFILFISPCYLFTQCRRLLEKFCATNSIKMAAVWLWNGQSLGWRFP